MESRTNDRRGDFARAPAIVTQSEKRLALAAGGGGGGGGGGGAGGGGGGGWVGWGGLGGGGGGRAGRVSNSYAPAFSS